MLLLKDISRQKVRNNMADIELVIKISEDYFEIIKHDVAQGNDYKPFKLIANGTPLDLEGLKSDMKALNCGFPYGLDYLLDCLDKRLGITITE